MNQQQFAFDVRLMTSADINAALGLSTLAGWNQTEADWRRLLSLEPRGCFVACVHDEIKGTVTTTSFQQRFGWIGMVLVHPDVRRCGMGSALLRRGVEYLESSGVATVKLDATPLGQPVYERAGFMVEYELARWEGTVTTANQSTLPAIQPADLSTIVEFDAQVFGADRSTLLRELYNAAPEYSAVACRNGEVKGYALGRRGIRANYLGPWIANDANTANQLAHSILSHWPHELVYVDVNLSNAHAVEVVHDLELRQQREFIRMYKGSNSFAGRPQWVCGIAGPEVG